jgi:alanyl-tRNA synthetase
MKFYTTDKLRKTFLAYFEEQGHQVVSSSSLVPVNDPTLLFTNAGMVQFKDAFLGVEQRAYTRATSSQRCVRAGGKHNDLEQVGYTTRHHTFFEMLGNFSFGDYFKREAIAFAWDFLTGVLKLPKDRLWVTVYHDDPESEKIWLEEMGVSAERFSRCGEKDNFWAMGDTGPCGPCSEIFYDHGPEIAGGPPGSPNEEGDRYVEIWNLVFMQFNRDMEGKLNPLPKPCVDTGMGLERIATVMQGVHDNYEIDVFKHLLAAVSELTGCDDFANKSMRVIADHIRSSAFLIVDGVIPSNEGRAYVLRRIIRRAVRHGYKLGVKNIFFYRLVPTLVEVMSEAYPELKSSQVLIENLLQQEEELFSNTLDNGLKILDSKIAQQQGPMIAGEVVFSLYDTYGFPPDLTADIARERGLSIDESGFEACMARQRSQSKASNRFVLDEIKQLHIKNKTRFLGYETLQASAKVESLIGEDNRPVTELLEGEYGIVVLDQTPFYAESGGQVGDSGRLFAADLEFTVEDTRKHSESYLHFGRATAGKLVLGGELTCEVSEARSDIHRNHSATHLLHQALREVLGEHVQQKGSLVDAKHLRFDFSHSKALTTEQIDLIEAKVNQRISFNVELITQETSIDQAKEAGAMALFGEKYAESIRVVKMGEFSHEVCGGTHVNRTGDIGLFKIVSESACAAGVRRIEAITGQAAVNYSQYQGHIISEIARTLNVKKEDMTSKLNVLLDDNKALQKQLQQLKQRFAAEQGNSALSNVIEVGQFKLLAMELAEADKNTLRQTVDQLKNQLGEYSVIVLAHVNQGKIALVAGIGKACVAHFKAGELLAYVAQQVGGKGGGRPEFAQGGGDQPDNLAAALASVSQWVRDHS